MIANVSITLSYLISQAPARAEVQIPTSLLGIAAGIAVLVIALGGLALLLQKLFSGRTAPLRESSYQRVASLFTPAELRFYNVLRSGVQPTHVIMAKVRIADLLKPVAKGPSFLSAFNKISAKHADFVLCDAQSMMPLLVIELDDASHARESRLARDEFVDRAYADAQLPILHIKVRASYSPAELRDQISRSLDAPAQSP